MNDIRFPRAPPSRIYKPLNLYPDNSGCKWAVKRKDLQGRRPCSLLFFLPPGQIGGCRDSQTLCVQQPGKLRQVDDFTMKGEATDPTAAHSLEGDSCCLQRATPAEPAWWRSGPHTYIRKTAVSGSNSLVLLHALLQDSLQAPSSLGQNSKSVSLQV